MHKPIISKSTWRVILILTLFGLIAWGIILYYHYQILKMEQAVHSDPSAINP